ncbi:CGNR zinc finger domain-containing protein [Nocardiopsis sp. RSe5-2]|uniref:CGNR zinc finger domain-containing protein n=2 Tax=Nocardiopsis endophytica TaxID=3018445 RepID=A0ABT4U1T1_9ACTN|nr:CGNR zinc finger domain-containing protein [Nocardiopsis endophytica]MDA2810894.1 CGNR zinc finger domain-containing protein [Nocardiopsis endophytica]
MSGVVEAAVRAVNLLVPGERGGRPHDGSAEAAELAGALAVAGRQYAHERPAPEEVEELRGLARRMYRVFAEVEAGDMDAACEAANALMSDTGAMPVLARHSDEPWHLHFHAIDAPWAVGWAAAMATGLAVVLGSASAERLGLCSAQRCDRVFADTSRNGTRRFCSTACQNRTKAAAFRARRREP